METRSKDQKTPPLYTTPRKGRQRFYFKPPPEAPIFRPTLEEFEDPLAYINQIRVTGEKSGICKIIPPSGWKSPFVLDKEKVKFTPRIQRINELEARTRIKLNFIDQLTKFFALRGKAFQIPMLEKSTLDLYTLHRIVREEGGQEKINKEKKWGDIATKMGYTSKTAFSVLKHHYENLIHPFLESQKVEEAKRRARSNQDKNKSFEDELADKMYCNKISSALRELRSLRFLGPGPKMAICQESAFLEEKHLRTRGKKILYEFDPLAKYMCKGCSTGDIEESLITCVACQDRYHSSCLIPALVDVPENWRCPKCVAAEVYKPLEDFGFAQAEREYTLSEFEAMANEFKRKYFKSEPAHVSTTKVEQEFWRVVSSIDEAVTVEYGADLHVIDHGSGFPRKKQPYVDGIDDNIFDEYANSAWNLNNLPVLESSVLRHISADISGMKIPWMYAGMCFATFCWHNEDHWSYSINYLHLGEPKTWYGVSGSNAEKFERAMKKAAPELFAAQPDLLHHLVTIMNPNDLTLAGVPVCRTDQKEGEFVITFPRAYHAGFNQGFNFAEACNFAPYDWLHIGRECISHYASLKRPCVFSHDELVCNMALIAEQLDDDIAQATMKDMLCMVSSESIKWNRAISFGIDTVMEFNYESIPDDERQCCECKTTVFLSGVFCPCNRSKLVCLEHIHKLCDCSPSNYIVKCQYRINYLKEVVSIMKSKLLKFDSWQKRVESALSASENKISLIALTELLIEAKEKDFPQHDLIDLLEGQVRKSINCSALARVIVNHRYAKKNIQNRLTIDEIDMFCKEVENLPCKIMEAEALKTLQSKAHEFQTKALSFISNNRRSMISKVFLKSCIQMGQELNLDTSELPALEKRMHDVEWMENVDQIIAAKESDLNVIQEAINSCPSSFSTNKLVSMKKNEIVKYFYSLKKCIEENNSIAHVKEINQVQEILNKSEQFNLTVPDKDSLKIMIFEAKNVQESISKALSGETVYYLIELETFVARGKSFNLNIDGLSELEAAVAEVRKWEIGMRKLFLRRNSTLSLMQALWPRRFESRSIHFQRNLSQRDYSFESLIDTHDENFSKSHYKKAAKEEAVSLKGLRLNNLRSRVNEVLAIKCACGEVIKSFPIVCVLCLTSFHSLCFKIDETILNSQVGGFTTRNLCSFCTRTKRPSFEAAEKFQIMAHSFKVKIPECLALNECLNRVKKWQKSVNKMLCCKEMISGFRTILSGVHENFADKSFRSKENWVSIKQRLSDPNRKLMSNGISLSGEARCELRQLMELGDMQEISSHESEQMWILYDGCQMKLVADISQETKKVSPIKLTLPKTVGLKKMGPKIQKIRKKSTTSVLIPSQSSSSGLISLVVKEPKKKRKWVKKKPKTIITVSSEGGPGPISSNQEEHEPEDKCASMFCLKPCDENVTWIQCDGNCKEWFHVKCVDLDASHMSEEDEFKCLNCVDVPEEDMMPPFKKIRLPCIKPISSA